MRWSDAGVSYDAVPQERGIAGLAVAKECREGSLENNKREGLADLGQEISTS